MAERSGWRASIRKEAILSSLFLLLLQIYCLIDDSNTDRLLYSKLLKNFAPDYSIETAATAGRQLNLIRSSPPALIITDHVMPEMNGYDLVLKLKKITISEVPPVIMY
jgi:CheY-like chemotaxis protein